MKAKMSYDSEADMGYIYLFSGQEISIDETEELEVNPLIALDLDRNKKIAGIELAGEEAAELKKLLYKGKSYTETVHSYLKTEEGLSLRIGESKVESRHPVSGVTLCFAGKDCTGFVGFDYDIKGPEGEK